MHIDTYYGSLLNMKHKFDMRARQDCFKGNTKEEFLLWQRSARRLLAELIGLDKQEKCELSPVTEEKITLENGIIREKVRIQTEPDVWMPMYILIPPERDGVPGCFLAPCGHQGGGKYSVAGCYDIPAVKEKIDFFNYDYGMKLAKKGYVAICPDARGFGERRDEALRGDGRREFMGCSCFHLAHMAEPLGQTVTGMLTWDLMRLLDYICQRGEWRTDNIGCLGFSGGGMQTMWLAALDERVKTAVISGYMYGYKESLMELNGNCSCNYVPHLWEHFDMGDIASLIAPRTVMIQSCREDKLNGERGLLNVCEQVDVIRRAYRLFDEEKRVVHDICEGAHRFHDSVLNYL